MFAYLAAILAVILIYWWRSYMETFKKWSHLPGVKPHWFWGNRPVFSKNIKDIYVEHYKALEGHRFGLFWSMNEACIFLMDRELIKRVQVTDFDHFTDFGFNTPQPEGKEYNQFGLADLKGEPWRKLKRAITPSFSTPRLKKNVSSMNECAKKLVGYLDARTSKESVEVIEFTKKYYLSCIASIGFGFNIDCFGVQESTFEKHAKTVFNISNFLLAELFPNVAAFFKVSIIDRNFSKYLSKLCRDVVKQRKDQNLQYNDMLNNLIEVSKDYPEMTDEIMYKTCVQFFSDGYESASLVFGVLVYYLTVYPEVQERLQEEIDEVFDGKADGEEIDQDDVTNMKYLDQVVNEGQRLAPFAMTARTCTKEWKIPGDSFVVPKNTRVIIPIGGLHLDEKYWPDPLVFDPERFSSENKSNIDSITFQTFGSGPRQCLGKNLYMVETKVMLIHLLRNLSFKPFGDMPKLLQWDMEAFIGKTKYDIKVERRQL